MTLQPRSFKLRTMFSFMPQSTATTLYFASAVREYHFFWQLTRRTASVGSVVFCKIRMAQSVGVEASQIYAFREPMSRIERVIFRVSTP